MSKPIDPSGFEFAEHGEGTPASALDDFAPATRHDVQVLTQRVQELRETADAALPREDAEAFQKENARIRRRVTFTILTAVLISIAVTTVGNDAVLKKCFLDSNRGALHHDTFCNTVFPGYNRTVDENNARLRQFNDLIGNIPENKKQIAHLQREIDHLKGH